MTASVPPTLEIRLFGGFELRAHGELVKNLPLRDADKLLTLLLFWDFVADRVRFEREGFELERLTQYEDLRLRFEKDLSQALRHIRETLPGELRQRLKDGEAKGFVRFQAEHNEVDAVRFWHGVQTRHVEEMKQGVLRYQTLLPAAWLPLTDADERSVSRIASGRANAKEQWIDDIRQRFEARYYEALTLLSAPNLAGVEDTERAKYLQILSENAPERDARDEAKRQLNALRQALALQTRPPARHAEPEISPPAPISIVLDRGKPVLPNRPSKVVSNHAELLPLGETSAPEIDVTLEEFERVFALATTANDLLNGHEHLTAMKLLEQESAAIYAVLDWCMADAAHYEKALLLADKVWQFWYIREPWKDARQRLEQILNLPGNQQPTLERAYVLNGAAVFALANAALSKAEQYLNECLKISHTLGSEDVAGGAYNTLGWHASVGKNADIRKAMRFCEQSLEAFTQADNRAACLWPLRGIGDCWRILGDRKQARKYYKQARNLGRETANIRGVAFVCNDFVRLDREEEDFNSAKKECVEGLRLWGQVNERHSFAGCLESVADFAKAIGCASESTTLYGAAYTIREHIEVPGWMYEITRLQAEYNILAEKLGDDFDTAWQQGVGMADDGARIIAFVAELSI